MRAANVFHFASGKRYSARFCVRNIPVNDHISYGYGIINEINSVKKKCCYLEQFLEIESNKD